MDNNIKNPYQHNVDIIKGFFKRPIVLVLAIMMTVSNLCSMFSGLILVPSRMFNEQLFSQMPSGYSSVTEDSSVGIALPATAILITISFFFFYFFSRSQRRSLNVPAKIFKIVSLVELIFVCIILGICIVLSFLFLLILAVDVITNGESGVIASLFGLESGALSSASLEVLLIVTIPLLVILVIISVFGILFSSMKYRFAKSIDKSMRGIHLYKNGAMGYGIFCILSGAFSLFSVISMFIVLTPLYAGIASLIVLIGVATNIIMGIVAIKYANYIKSVSVKFNTEPVYVPETKENFDEAMPFGNIQGVTSQNDGNPYAQPLQENTFKFCTQCGNKVSTDDLFCNKCGNKLN